MKQTMETILITHPFLIARKQKAIYLRKYVFDVLLGLKMYKEMDLHLNVCEPVFYTCMHFMCIFINNFVVNEYGG